MIEFLHDEMAFQRLAWLLVIIGIIIHECIGQYKKKKE